MVFLILITNNYGSDISYQVNLQSIGLTPVMPIVVHDNTTVSFNDSALPLSLKITFIDTGRVYTYGQLVFDSNNEASITILNTTEIRSDPEGPTVTLVGFSLTYRVVNLKNRPFNFSFTRSPQCPIGSLPMSPITIPANTVNPIVVTVFNTAVPGNCTFDKLTFDSLFQFTLFDGLPGEDVTRSFVALAVKTIVIPVNPLVPFRFEPGPVIPPIVIPQICCLRQRFNLG
ncbi:MAG: hypothetical protein Edafosvirus19_4 [Edafosvirus sp.]|uniref:Uncharacterized protein n=1 Tax=Edafosvirus sp. TaxID=2487765 RepID=A0A3G4ZUK9_9VIRU|nr:MAG: hypothetical protein Edafosvirus19_4 [Edafosvirus sp.]